MFFYGDGAPPSPAPNHKDRAVVIQQEFEAFAQRLLPLLPLNTQQRRACAAIQTAFIASLFAVRLPGEV